MPLTQDSAPSAKRLLFIASTRTAHVLLAFCSLLADSLPQKAGMRQEFLNEIHGSLHAPDNPVIAMSGCLREDALADLLDLEQRSDLTLAVGTSLAGMNADRIVHSVAERASRGKALGSVLVGLQRTRWDGEATLRIFARCDDVFRLLAAELCLGDLVPAEYAPGWVFCPPVLLNAAAAAAAAATALDNGCGTAAAGSLENGANAECYVQRGVSYDAMGRRLLLPGDEPPHTLSSSSQSSHAVASWAGGDEASEGEETAPGPRRIDLDLRDGAALIIPSGQHAGATGEVDGCDREGHPRCRFMLRLKKGGTFKAPMVMALGTWWLQAASDASVITLPVVNVPSEGDTSEAAAELRALQAAY